MDPARIKLTVKLGTLLVGAVMTIWSLHGLVPGAGSHPATNLVRTGLSGVCADQAATAAAAGTPAAAAPATSAVPAADQAMAAAIGDGSLTCPPTSAP